MKVYAIKNDTKDQDEITGTHNYQKQFLQGGVGLFGTLTSYLASLFVEQTQKEDVKENQAFFLQYSCARMTVFF